MSTCLICSDPAGEWGVCITHRLEELTSWLGPLRVRDDDLFYADLLDAPECEEAVEAVHLPRRLSWEPRGAPYGRAAMRGIIERFGGEVASGAGRNNAMNSAAYAAGRIVGGELVEEESALCALMEAGLAVGLSAREARAAIRSGFAKGRTRPKILPDRDGPDGTR